MRLDIVDAILARQLLAVQERVTRSAMDFDQPDEIQRMRQVMAELDERLGSPLLLSNLANLDSKRATLLIEMPDRRRGVLKVAGVHEAGEAEVLHLWNRAGVPAVLPIDAGHIRATSYLLTEYRHAPTVERVLSNRMAREQALALRAKPHRVPRDDALRHTMREVFTALNAAHLPLASKRSLRPVTHRLRDPLKWSLQHLRDAGLGAPADLAVAMSTIMRGRNTLLHGDPWVGNMLYDRGVVLIDPVACYGPPEYDVAQAICGVTPPTRFNEMFQLAHDIDPRLDPAMMRLCAGVYMTMEAGLNTKALTHRAGTPGRTKEAILRGRGRDTLAFADTLLHQGIELRYAERVELAG